MEAFLTLDEIAVPMPAVNIDTDQILPARFLPKLRAEGLGPCLFHDLRFDAGGGEQPDFVLNQPIYRRARILVAGRNFGCGSSRESAVYALYDGGFRAIVAAALGDIFHANCLKNGLLPVMLPEGVVTDLLATLAAQPGRRLQVDLQSQTLTAPDGRSHHFEINGMRKHMLLNGVDEIDYTLGLVAEIEAFERRATLTGEGGQP